MSLIEKLFDANEPDRNIIIAEAPSSEDYEEKRQRVEEGFRTIFGRTTKVDVIPPESARATGNLDSSVLLLNSGDGSLLPNPERISSVVKLAYEINQDNPNSRIAVTVNHYDAEPMKMVLDLVLPVFLGSEGIYDHAKGFLESIDVSKSVLDYLDSRMGSIRHSIGNLQNAAFREWLAKRYQDGNLQSTVQENFLIVSGRAKKESKGIFHVIPPEELDSTDFLKYLAVFVDNDDNDSNRARLGNGIRTLEHLSQLGVEVPIFYETAHSIEDFSSEDATVVASYKALLIPKNLAPKISRTKKMAERELIIGELVKNDQDLSKYCVSQIRMGEEGYVGVRNGFLTFTLSAPKIIEKDFHKEDILKKAGLQENDLNHKLYVLSLFHSRLKHFVSEPSLASDERDYFDFYKIAKSLQGKADGINSKLIQLRDQYHDVVNRHRQHKPTTVSHNDAKWDNWFHGKILGDFGSATIGREYKDLARVLIDPDDYFSFTFNEENVRGAIDSYLAIRRQVDPEFNEDPNEFRKNVYEMLFVESLRIASYKAQNQSASLAAGLLRVAEKYAGLTREPIYIN